MLSLCFQDTVVCEGKSQMMMMSQELFVCMLQMPEQFKKLKLLKFREFQNTIYYFQFSLLVSLSIETPDEVIICSSKTILFFILRLRTEGKKLFLLSCSGIYNNIRKKEDGFKLYMNGFNQSYCYRMIFFSLNVNDQE